MQAKSIKGNSIGEVEAALRVAMSDGFAPTLAIVFISVRQNRQALVEVLRQQNIDVFGCTSCGEFIDNHQSKGEIVLLLLEAKRENYVLLLEDVHDNQVEAAAVAIAQTALHHFENPTFILTCNGIFKNGLYFDGNTLVQVLVRELGDSTVFFGGMAGDDWLLKNSYVFTHLGESANGIVALVFDGDKVALQGMAIHGWKPLGILRKVTKSIGNKVYSIDGKPAADLYLKYLGVSEKAGDGSFDIFRELSVHFPFIAKRDDGETIIKSPRAIDKETNALVMDIDMKEGDEFYFSTPPDFEISAEIVAEALAVKTAVESSPDAMLIFSCAGRPPVLGPLTTT